ncbi:phosphatidylglycerophosphatase A family protein [Yunchengibacter salinarum]|uniref:phosphatidylglycerophosphatase A family protein n=1 Tax=Yunchengibacter salinarum TaxID=3133399 RepID=UPI0035B5936A
MGHKGDLGGWQGRYRSPFFWWVVWFGAGLMRPAPGTWGSLAAVILGYFMLRAGMTPGELIGLVVFGSTVSVTIIGQVERLSGIHDAPEVVIDEVFGQWLALVPVAVVGLPVGWAALAPLLVAFGLFRLFDIWKPFPIGWMDRHIGGGTGVMVDDLMAGLMAALGLVLLYMMGAFHV